MFEARATHILLTNSTNIYFSFCYLIKFKMLTELLMEAIAECTYAFSNIMYLCHRCNS